jgi:hypothetical protein
MTISSKDLNKKQILELVQLIIRADKFVADEIEKNKNHRPSQIPNYLPEEIIWALHENGGGM